MKNLLLLICSTFILSLTIALSGQVFAGMKTCVAAEGVDSRVNQALRASLIVAPDSTQQDPKKTQRESKKGPFRELDIKVYPNPGSGLFKVEMNNKEPMAFRFKVYNLTGKEVLTEAARPVTACKTTLNLTPYSDGIYLLSIQTGEHKKVIKLLKQ